MHIKPACRSLVALLFILFWNCVWVDAQEIVFAVKNPGDAEEVAREFERVIRIAEEIKGTVICFAEGRYRISAHKSARFMHEKYHLVFKGLKDCVIQGNGAELIFTDPAKGGIQFRDCENIIVQGLNFDWDPLPFSQGEIVSVNGSDNSFLVKLSKGYPELDAPNYKTAASILAYIFNHSSDSLVSGVGRNPAKVVKAIRKQKEGLFEIILHPHMSFDGIAVKRRVVVLTRRPNNGVVFHRCIDAVIRDCRMYSSSHIGIRFSGACQKPKVKNIQIVRKPHSGRLISTNADGIFSVGCRGGPLIEGCLFEGVMDDAIPLPVYGREVLQINGGMKLLMRSFYNADWRVGDEVCAIDRNGVRKEFILKVLSIKKSEPVVLHNKKVLTEEVIFGAEKEYGIEPGWFLFDLNAANSGFVIRNNVIRDVRGKGIKAHGMNGVIDNNLIDGTTYAGIEVGYRFEKHPVRGNKAVMWGQNVKIRNNTLLRTTMYGLCPVTSIGWSTAIRIHCGPDNLRGRCNSDIEISGNTIDYCGQAAVRVWCVDRLIINNNKIGRTNLLKMKSEDKTIDLINVSNIKQK